jgi:hypothetical protein
LQLRAHGGPFGPIEMRQALSASSCTQRTPAGLPCGMPGIGELMDGAMQQAPQWGRQFISLPAGPGLKQEAVLAVAG